MDTSVEQKMKLFWENGYVLFESIVGDDVVGDLLCKVDKLKYVPIFKNINTKEYDDNRLQASIQRHKWSIPLKQVINDQIIAKVSQMRWTSKNWVVLKSLPGGEEQSVHRDFPSFEIGRARATDSIQAGLIVGLMNDTKLIVYKLGPNEVNANGRRIITFGKGDCLLFRGDLLHAGADYDTLNYRIHSAITVDGVDWNQNATETVPTVLYKCDFCPFMTNDRKQVYNHKMCCKHNPNLALIKEQRKKRIQKSVQCEECVATYTNTESYSKHYYRKHGGKKLQKNN